MYNQQQQQNQQGQQQGLGMNSVTAKELAYISDCIKNEELLAKLAVQGISEASHPQMKQKLAQIAQERLQHTDQLLRTLQQHTQVTH